MEMNTPYKTLTREQFLFHEMRTTAKLMNDDKSNEEIMNEIFDNNLFQYPTERSIRNIASVCIRRLESVNSKEIVEMIADGPTFSAKQACLYAMMMNYHLVWDFMTTVIAEKFRSKDFYYPRRDLNAFFTRLQEQNNEVASWSDETIKKSKSVLNRILIETEYLDSSKSDQLNPVLIDQELKEILIDKKEYAALAAFNCFVEV